MARLAVRDTAAARELANRAVSTHGLDPAAHALLADLDVGRPETGEVVVEAFAARVLAPNVGRGWWRWGYVQGRDERYEQSAHSVRRALALGLDPADDAVARRVLAELETVQAGSALAQQELRRTNVTPSR
jgi:hypothetical protein